MNSQTKKLQFDASIIEKIVRNQYISTQQFHQVNEVDSSKNQDSESSGMMSSGESDPEAREEKKLKHDEQVVRSEQDNQHAEMIQTQLSIAPLSQRLKLKSQWFQNSDTRLPSNASFCESDLMTQISFQDPNQISQESNYPQDFNPKFFQYQNLLENKKLTSSEQSLPKKKMMFSGNNSFSHDFQSQVPSPAISYTPFQQQQVNRRQYAPQTEIIKYQIDLTNIEFDGRTTLMIRNIPNKYSQNFLMEDINKTHADRYDFIYLPIDFTNKCNVGYAFINFFDVKFIKEFYIQYQGQRWKMFNSEKVIQYHPKYYLDLLDYICSYIGSVGTREAFPILQYNQFKSNKFNRKIYSIGQQDETSFQEQDIIHNTKIEELLWRNLKNLID